MSDEERENRERENYQGIRGVSGGVEGVEKLLKPLLNEGGMERVDGDGRVQCGKPRHERAFELTHHHVLLSPIYRVRV